MKIKNLIKVAAVVALTSSVAMAGSFQQSLDDSGESLEGMSTNLEASGANFSDANFWQSTQDLGNASYALSKGVYKIAVKPVLNASEYVVVDVIFEKLVKPSAEFSYENILKPSYDASDALIFTPVNDSVIEPSMTFISKTTESLKLASGKSGVFVWESGRIMFLEVSRASKQGSKSELSGSFKTLLEMPVKAIRAAELRSSNYKN